MPKYRLGTILKNLQNYFFLSMGWAKISDLQNKLTLFTILILPLICIAMISVPHNKVAQAKFLSSRALHPLPLLHFPLPQDIVQIVAGGDHTCALLSSGGVKCWGSNSSGQLGDGTTSDQVIPVDVMGLSSGVDVVTAGDRYTCAVLSSGGVKCWGGNILGQLGDGTTNDQLTPVDVVGLSSGVSAVTAGSAHTCALLNSGGVKCWGSNYLGQLGDGTASDRLTPVGVVGLSSGVSAITTGIGHTCALLSSGGVKCWGGNDSGQLGDDSRSWQPTPVDVVGLSSGVSTVIAGGGHTCALLNSGGVKCWGNNDSGELGDGTTSDQPTPVDVISLSSGTSAVTAGGDHTCAVLNSGAVKCWGFNDYGQLGDSTRGNKSTPVDVVGLSSDASAVTAGSDHTCASLRSGGVKCWGFNNYGQLGDGTSGNQSTPVDVVGLSSGVTIITTGNSHTCAVLSSGGVKCWGANNSGQLGDGTTGNQSTPIDVVGLSSGVSTVTAGGHTCALLNNGGIKCWGNNSYGELGDGSKSRQPTPVDVVGLSSGVSAVTAGYRHTCALLNSGGVKCWGYNNSGELGDGTTSHQSTPVDVVGLSSGVSAVIAGSGHTCALLSSGGVKCWGDNNSGELGDGTTNNQSTPVDVVGLSSGVSAITVGGGHTCALLNSGGVKCWGYNIFGQLGDGSTRQRLTPVDVVNLSNSVSAVTAGASHTCAVLSSGGVKCWGRNYAGELGDGTADRQLTPVDVVGLSNGVSAVTAGFGHTCALLSSGGVKCWGSNYSGELGDGNAWRTTPVDVMFEAITNTPVPPTKMPTPTNTPVLPTETPVPPTPTNTPIPPSETPAPTPTTIPLPVATATPTSPNSLNSRLAFLPLVKHEPTSTSTPTPPSTWKFLGTTGGQPAALAVVGSTLLVGDRSTSMWGIYGADLSACTTPDFAASFQPRWREAPVYDIAASQSTVLAGTEQAEVLRSTDGGVTWNPTNSIIEHQVAAVAIVNGIFYAGSLDETEDPNTTGVFKSTDGGSSWYQIPNSPKAINQLQFEQNVLWIGTQGQCVWRLNTNNDSLTQLCDGLHNSAAREVYDIVANDVNNQVYLATSNGVYTGDGNGVWMTFGLSNISIRSLGRVGQMLYAGTWTGSVATRNLASGTDWESSIKFANGLVRDLVYDNANCDALLAATDDGVWILR